MATRIIREKSMGTPRGGGMLSVSADGITLTINNVTRFRHAVSRFVEAVPLPGGEEEGDPESGAIVFDTGGVRIEYSLEFILTYSNEEDLYDDYADIDAFFSTISVLETLRLEVDENNWVGDDARTVVLKSFDLERVGGEKNVIRGRVVLLGGRALG